MARDNLSVLVREGKLTPSEAKACRKVQQQQAERAVRVAELWAERADLLAKLDDVEAQLSRAGEYVPKDYLVVES